MLFVASTPVAYAKTCELDVQMEMVETSNPSSGAAKAFRPRRYGWTVNVSGLVAANMNNTDDLLDNLKDGTECYIVIGKVTWSGSTPTKVVGQSYGGGAFISGLRQSGTHNEKATFSAQLQGNGTLDKTTV